MVVFPDIEMYVEVLSGYKDIFGKSTFWLGTKALIKMSDFDTQFITSLGEQLYNGKAITDRQATTIDRILTTYAPQLAAHCIGLPDHKNYKLGIRTINRSSCLALVDNKLHFRFPFNADMVAQIKDFARTSQGAVGWNSQIGAWEFANTEYNLSWAVALAQSHNIEVASNCLALFDQIVELEQTPYKIELGYNNGKFSISNAPDSMIEYIENSIGFDNIYSLVDMSGALGYTVSDEITTIMASELGESFMKLCSDRNVGMPATSELEEIIEWAIAVDRLPICIFAPNFLKPRLGCLPKYFREDEILVVRQFDPISGPFTIDPAIKVVYTTQVIPVWEKRLPLLISQVNLMHGTAKRAFIEVAEKVVYHCTALPR